MYKRITSQSSFLNAKEFLIAAASRQIIRRTVSDFYKLMVNVQRVYLTFCTHSNFHVGCFKGNGNVISVVRMSSCQRQIPQKK